MRYILNFDCVPEVRIENVLGNGLQYPCNKLMYPNLEYTVQCVLGENQGNPTMLIY